jgi:hypothetical protein
MGPFDVFGNVFLLTPKAHADRIYAEVGAQVDQKNGLAFGACRLPNDAGWSSRYSALSHSRSGRRCANFGPSHAKL